MKDIKEDLLCMKPVNNYEAPKIPTLGDTKNNPELLKKLPSRWRKNAAVIACIGLTGALTLSGCANALEGLYPDDSVDSTPSYTATPPHATPTYTLTPTDDAPYYTPAYTVSPTYTFPPYTTSPSRTPNPQTVTPNQQRTPHRTPNNTPTRTPAPISTPTPSMMGDLNLRVHHGGSGGGPMYIVHLTEQEALGIIRQLLMAAGLNFNATPPRYTVNNSWSGTRIGLDLFDRERGVAISRLSWTDSHRHFSPTGGAFADIVVEGFREQTSAISIGVFYNPGETIGWGGSPWDQDESNVQEPTPARAAAARPVLERRLTAQVQTFITFLRAEGII